MTARRAPSEKGGWRKEEERKEKESAQAVKLTATVRSANGTIERTVPLEFPANYFMQTSSSALLGGSIEADASISFRVDSLGSLVLK